ncbi:MAG: helix-turn-helix transcriptional regulator [Spirochaetales bacterium]|nr:helix-turn-helix transcriptional regulator [Spirochaetales bacterium]
MQHIIFFYLIVCFGIVTGSVFVFAIFYFKYKLSIINYYMLLFACFVVRLFIFLHTYYMESIITTEVTVKIANLIARFVWSSFFTVVLSLFYFHLVEKKITIAKKAVIASVFLLQYFFIILPFLSNTTIVDVYDSLKRIFIYANNSLLAVFLLYFFVNAILGYDSIESSLSRKLVKVNCGLLIILVPVLIIDILEKGGTTDFLPNGLLLIYLYSAAYSIIHIRLFYDYFIKRIEISVNLGMVPESFIASNKITNRETDIIKLLIDNYTYRKIADSLFISERTVECHVSNIYKKAHVKSKAELLELIKVFESIN